jgi:hypothetical protein
MSNKLTITEDLKALEALDEKKLASNNKVQIMLDVGGRMFRTYKSTLVKADYFKNMFGDNFKSDEVVFVDRNPKMFYYILEYLRIGMEAWVEAHLNLPNKTKKLLLYEAGFYLMNDFKMMLSVLLDAEAKKEEPFKKEEPVKKQRFVVEAFVDYSLELTNKLYNCDIVSKAVFKYKDRDQLLFIVDTSDANFYSRVNDTCNVSIRRCAP